MKFLFAGLLALSPALLSAAGFTSGPNFGSCANASHKLVAASTASPLGFNYTGPLSFNVLDTGCTVNWTAEEFVFLLPGSYQTQTVLDFTQTLGGATNEFYQIDLSATTQLVGVAGSIVTVSQTVSGPDGGGSGLTANGVFSNTNNSTTFAWGGGNVTLRQTFSLGFQKGGTIFSQPLISFHFPVASNIVNISDVPEPGTLGLIGACLLLAGSQLLRRRSR